MCVCVCVCGGKREARTRRDEKGAKFFLSPSLCASLEFRNSLVLTSAHLKKHTKINDDDDDDDNACSAGQHVCHLLCA